MHNGTILQKLMASGLSILLASCSTIRPTLAGPSGPEDLAKYVLIVKGSSHGQAEHLWQPVKDFDLTKYPRRASSSNLAGHLVRVASGPSHCDAKQTVCIAICTSSPVPIPIEGEEFQEDPAKWLKHRGRWCQSTCTKFHAQCIRGWGPWAERRVHVEEFKAIDTAVDWIKTHREQIVEGTVIVIAGVAFVAAVFYSGGLILVFTPLVLVASAARPAALPTSPSTTEVMNADPRRPE